MRLKVLPGLSRNIKVALCSGLIAAGCAGAFLVSVKSDAAAKEQEVASDFGGVNVEVCVANRDIAGGETISESDIEVKPWVNSLLPVDAVRDVSECEGKQLGSSILKGEVISSARFQSEDAKINVPTGKVAVSLPLNDTSSVGGTLRVNQKVDVYATGSTSTTKICSNVQILETSNSDKTVNSETKWITVAVDKEKAQEVVSAAQKLSLYVVLPSDKEMPQVGDLMEG